MKKLNEATPLSKKECLTLFENTLNDPKAQKIEYTISQNYVSTLEEFWGIKELLANFRDANGSDFDMSYEKGSLLLSDQNEGIDIKYMIIGNSGSREESTKIGEHGEGMKIGALTLVRLGYKVLIHTVGYTIAFSIEHSDLLETDLMYAKYTQNDKKVGTDIFIECKKSEYDKARQMFLSLVEHEEITENIIDLPNKVKDIYLNGLSHVQKKAVFGYNIKRKGLISNRDRNFIQQSLLDESIAKFYDNLSDEQSIEKIMNGFLAAKGNFDKMLESRLLERFSFSDSLKAKFRKALPKNAYFIKNEKDKLPDNTQEAIVVNARLFNFLNYIGAKVVMDTGEYSFGEDESVIHSFIIPKDKIPSELDLETNLANMIGSFGILEDNKSIYPLTRFNLMDEDDLKQFKISLRAYKTNQHGEFNNILNNLLLLSSYGTSISFEYEGTRFSIDSKSNHEKVQIFILKEEVDTDEALLVIQKETPFPKGKSHMKQKDNFIYLQQLRYRSINSIYSYQVDLIDPAYRWNGLEYGVSDKVEEILNALIKRGGKEFFESLFKSINYNLYETKISLVLNEKAKKLARNAFEKFNKNACLSSNGFFNKVVKENYNYKTLDIPQGIFRELLENTLSIPTSENVYVTKQNEDIHTIPYTEEMNEAVKLFRTSVNTDIEINMTALLPDMKESTNRNGIIYISRNGSEIPEFLAALMFYEYEQISNECATPSHTLQSELTYNLLG